MNSAPKPSLVKRSLRGHSWIGLFAGAFMYMICLSGTLAVLYQEFERWEQPYVDEYQNYDIAKVERAFQDFVAQNPEDTGHYHVVFPDSGIPRVVVENDHVAQFVNTDGSLGAMENPTWTKMLLDLHLYLHLPETVGIMVVSVFGALLCSLIISGVLAHKRIFKDAFRFRRGGNAQLEQTDIHNRLSVWGLPFHLMIAITGAYFGLASLIVIVVAQAFHEGDRAAVMNLAFGEEPKLSEEVHAPDIGRTLSTFSAMTPDDVVPIFLTVHEANSPAQFVEIYATQPGRLVYSENYRFDQDGNFINRDGVSDGPTGRQIIYSIYRLHFGHFGGDSVKILYVLLGLALTIVSVTGINIWLQKRKHQDYINDLWVGIVWGAPIGLTLSALAAIVFGLDLATIVVWLSIITAGGFALKIKNDARTSEYLKLLLACTLIVLTLSYGIRFGDAAFNTAALQINIPLFAYGALLLLVSFRKMVIPKNFAVTDSTH